MIIEDRSGSRTIPHTLTKNVFDLSRRVISKRPESRRRGAFVFEPAVPQLYLPT